MFNPNHKTNPNLANSEKIGTNWNYRHLILQLGELPIALDSEDDNSSKKQEMKFLYNIRAFNVWLNVLTFSLSHSLAAWLDTCLNNTPYGTGVFKSL